MIVVTGGTGFIGSNLVYALNAAGREDIVVVDDLTDGRKVSNVNDLIIADYFDKTDFIERVRTARFPLGDASVVFHLGACSDTTEWNGRFVMENNYRYSVDLLDACSRIRTPLVYASSAAVYGGSAVFREDPRHERPLNVYGYSKLLMDQVVRRRLAAGELASQVVGLRFFNVYGPREQHKGPMASVAFHLHQQLINGDTVRLFEGRDGFGDGEQRRDFVYVDDVVAVMRWFGDHPRVSGVFNVGTGKSSTFNQVAEAVLAHHGRGQPFGPSARGHTEYIPFPAHLVGVYQSFTEANLERLRAVGCEVAFADVAHGVASYMRWLGGR